MQTARFSPENFNSRTAAAVRCTSTPSLQFNLPRRSPPPSTSRGYALPSIAGECSPPQSPSYTYGRHKNSLPAHMSAPATAPHPSPVSSHTWSNQVGWQAYTHTLPGPKYQGALASVPFHPQGMSPFSGNSASELGPICPSIPPFMAKSLRSIRPSRTAPPSPAFQRKSLGLSGALTPQPLISFPHSHLVSFPLIVCDFLSLCVISVHRICISLQRASTSLGES